MDVSETALASAQIPVTIQPGYLIQQAKGASLARRRYQRGSVFLRGKREKVWIGRWLDDELQPDGTVIRRHRSEVLGTKADLPTKRLAQRELDALINKAGINAPTYKARPTSTFSDFSERWMKAVLPNHKPSSQAGEKSDIKSWVAAIGDVQLKDINTELLQSKVAGWKGKKSPKTIRNRVTTFRLLWNSAKAWGYVTHNPCEGLILPDWDRPEQPVFNLEHVQKIICKAEPPYDTVFWLVFETGIRRGEVCALNVGHVDLGNRIIVIRASKWNKHITETKSRKPRVFSLSPQLTERLRFFVEGRSADEPLFVTGKGKRLHPDNFVKRKLKPILEILGLQGAMHAFRHGNATTLDGLNVPLKVRQERLGHVDPRTTMSYTHLVSEDDRRTAAELGKIICLNLPKMQNDLEGANSQVTDSV